MGYSAGVLAIFYKVAIGSGIAPLVIFMGVGAMTDFGPLLANPRTLLLGAAAQFGIFATVLGALTLNYFGIISFTLPQAAAIGIIGGADGPTAIYLSGKLAPELTRGHRGGGLLVYGAGAADPAADHEGADQRKERKIRMVQLRTVSKREKILFPAVLLLLVALLLPDAAPLLGMFCFGNLMRERGGGAPERHGAERADQHRDHLPRAVGGGQAGGGQVPAAADAGDPGAGGDRLLRGDRGRGADGEAAEPVQPEQNQPADRLGRGVGGADGGRVSNKVGLERTGRTSC
jgi:oxaloacetate decarboxylase beta subunit